jgi:ankyrin repeat protein
MPDNRGLVELMQSIGSGDVDDMSQRLAARPELAVAQLAKGPSKGASDEFFLVELRVQIYVGDTALHVAAAGYNLRFAEQLVKVGADVRARNRRGAEPIHAALTGGPGSPIWNPSRQAAMVTYLVEVGADPDARAAGGVTPLHRAVRNRCSAAVGALLEVGADPRLTNDSGSTALSLAHVTTGRGGTGSPEAKAEQAAILRLLEAATR